MTAPAYPFTAFSFAVEIYPGDASAPLVNAAFAECDGLEMNHEVKTIREGGNNMMMVHFVGPVSYGQLTLKRGMMLNFDLWKWFSRVNSPGYRGVRSRIELVVVSSDGTKEDARFIADGCLPIKLKAPAMNAKEGQVAIEEMQIAYQTLTLRGSAGS